MGQHDDTKRMLGLIRESISKKNKVNKIMLREQSEPIGGKEDLSPADYAEEQQKFRNTVSPRVKFTSFKLYPNSQNVEFSGEFTDSKIEWFYSLDDTRGVYITGTFIQLSDEVLKTQIQKLVAYYETWSDEWATRIAEEYKNEIVDEENAEDGPVSVNSPEFGGQSFSEEDEIENV